MQGKRHTMKPDITPLLVGCWTALAASSAALQSQTEAAEVKVARGALYGTVKYVAPQGNATQASIYDPGVFEGTQNVEFDSGGGFGFSLGAVGEEEWYFAGLEFEFLMNSSEISTPLPSSTIFDEINSLDQVSLNLNLLLGTDLGDRRPGEPEGDPGGGVRGAGDLQSFRRLPLQNRCVRLSSPQRGDRGEGCRGSDRPVIHARLSGDCDNSSQDGRCECDGSHFHACLANNLRVKQGI